jgi:hypothetical protein
VCRYVLLRSLFCDIATKKKNQKAPPDVVILREGNMIIIYKNMWTCLITLFALCNIEVELERIPLNVGMLG